MSRGAGFPIGDRSTRTLYDVRLIRAARRAGPAAVIAWDAIVDASWEAGCRVAFDDAVDPLPYDMTDSTEIRAALVSVGLLDTAGLIREESWGNWFLPAYERREKCRETGRRGGLAKARSSDPRATLERPLSKTLPVPSVPSVPILPAAVEVSGDKPRASELGPAAVLGETR